MSDASESPSRQAFIWFAALTVVGAVLDLGSKAWAVDALTDLPNQAIMVAEPWLEMALSYNRGTAFSAVFDLGESMRLILGIGALAVVVGLAWTVWTNPTTQLEAGAFGLLAAGAVGNGYDRVMRQAPGGGTGVVDFVKVNYPWGGSWPTFNIADAWLVVGVVLLAWGWLQASRAAKNAA
ncbi:MAG: signal peptidase II [Myxococcales bacterium]|nr:signal peptidase II [Myxococcales bacterium]